MKALKLILILLVLTSTVDAKYRIRKIGIEQGLSGNNIVGITQDDKGFIWIATKSGLNRFDGNKIKVFKSNGTESGINSNELNKVIVDNESHSLWIPTERTGLNVYSLSENKFSHITHDWNPENLKQLSSNGITDVFSESQSSLWIANYAHGVDLYHKESQEFTHFRSSTVKNLISDYVWSIAVDKDQNLYIGHVYEGFSIVNTKNRTAQNYKNNPDDPNSLPGNEVKCVFLDSNGKIWLGTNNGLALFNPQNRKFIVFRNTKLNPNSLSDNFIQTITQTRDKKIWIGTANGINILDFDKEIFTDPKSVSFEHIPVIDTPQGLSGSSIMSIFQDVYGNMWIGTKTGGVNFIPSKPDFFLNISYLPIPGNVNSLSNKIVYDLENTSNNTLWVATLGGGVDVYQNNQKTTNYKFENFPNGTNSVSSVFEDPSGNIWVGTDNGLLALKSKNDKGFKNVPNVLPKGVLVFGFASGLHNVLWIATNRGLYSYDLQNKVSKIYNTATNGISDNVIRSVNTDTFGNVWIGTLGGGLNVLNPATNKIRYFSNSSGFIRINDIFRDSKNRMWIGTKDRLILFQNPNTDSFLTFDSKDGFADTDIKTIVEGKNPDEIWLATGAGISFFDLKSKKVYNFNQNDGLPYSEYMIGSGTRTSNGNIYFGTQNGITFFNSQNALPKYDIPPVVISDFLVVNKEDQFSPDSSFLMKNEKVVLKYNQNTFNVHFNVLDYSLSGKLQFVYQMEGLGDNWYNMKGERQLTFRDLRPGTYTLKIRAGSRNQSEMTEISKLEIVINPPFWLSWWAKTLYVIIVLLISYYVLRFYKRKFDLENSLYLEKQNHEQEQRLNDERLKFFTNITHELRTPLSLIVGPIEDLISDNSLSNPQRKKLNSIHKSAFRLLELINQILEFRKSETHNRKLNVTKSSIIEFVRELVIKYEVLNQNKNVEFSFSFGENIQDIYFDVEVMTIILDNLISNALKYTNKGKVSVDLEEEILSNLRYTRIKIKDTGIGIPADQLNKIFDRYFQVKGEHKVSGTGIGLSLVKNLSDLHEAKIEVNSIMNEGSEFVISLLTDNIYPDALHMEDLEKPVRHVELPGEQKLSLLVVEDNPEILDYISDCFNDSFDIQKAENGMEGLELARTKLPDIIISDVMMPIMDGFELCKQIKCNLNTSHIPVILLTAKDSIQDKTEGYQVGADSYVTKPFSASLLKSRVDNLLEARKKMNEMFTSKTNIKQVLVKESVNKLDNEFISKFVEHVEDNLENENLNVDHISDKLFMSHSTLYRKIKSLTGMSPNEFVRKIRMVNAEKLLLTCKYSVSEIMIKVGVNSPAYFRQCFRDEFGVTPTEYMQNIKNSDSELPS